MEKPSIPCPGAAGARVLLLIGGSAGPGAWKRAGPPRLIAPRSALGLRATSGRESTPTLVQKITGPCCAGRDPDHARLAAKSFARGEILANALPPPQGPSPLERPAIAKSPCRERALGYANPLRGAGRSILRDAPPR